MKKLSVAFISLFYSDLQRDSSLSGVFLPNKQLTCSISIFKRTEPQNDDEQIYKGELNRNIFRVKAFSLISSGVGLGYLPITIYKVMNDEISMLTVVMTGSIIGFFTFGTPILLHLLAKRYVTAVSYSKETDSYVAKTYSFFLTDNVLKFKADEVVIPETPPFLTSFLVQGHPLFVDPSSFTDVNHYKRFMKYDEPLDLKILSEINEKRKIK
ncbi:transmembrane protein 70 homolog, mitochondrial isoform X2 [Nilaparvata lugens]|uniref:transmembrane protein 70 homolog, mitochondrial isoform X2 n=1 Tax=Nilaparvata lugens TaxID=108931 RepID=UPI00193D116E|nr:transmembrane protein 70 homolog, mitochondrial isoform X2 [Nilaparvata lugens]